MRKPMALVAKIDNEIKIFRVRTEEECDDLYSKFCDENIDFVYGLDNKKYMDWMLREIHLPNHERTYEPGGEKVGKPTTGRGGLNSNPFGQGFSN